MSINEIEFLSPLYFTLIGLVPILILLFYLKKTKKIIKFYFLGRY